MSADTEMLRSYQLKNAYTNGVRFDVQDPAGDVQKSEDSDPEIPVCNADVNLKDSPSKDWDPDVSALITSTKWLSTFGLQKNRLDFNSLLSTIGFKHSDDFDGVLKRPVSSRYANTLFNRIFRPDGKTFNITADKGLLKVLEARLIQAIMLYKRRLDWLTSESRRIFGVITEKCPVIVIDIRNMSPQQFDQYRSALERVLKEQVKELTKFNIIRAVEDIEMYNKDCLPVTHDTIEGAVQWLWGLDRLAPVSKTATCEAVVKALQDRNAEAVYLFTEGAAVDGSREILKEKISKLQVKTPVHVISYNCTDSDTIHYLKDLSKFTGGKFHAYAVTMEMDIYEGMPVNPKNSRANIVLKRKTYGGVPPGAGVREDVLVIFEELETARNNLEQVQAVLKELPEPKLTIESKISKQEFKLENREEYQSSAAWLKTYGLGAQKLGLFDILGGVVFKHQDGVVNVLEKPCHGGQTDAVSHEKLINARYCDRFPVVKWKDGFLAHVQVSPEIHRSYEQKMRIALNKIQQRIDWLSQGSRELFGTVLEEQIYILVDTSSSMVPHLQFVKDKLFLLLQEQLRHKMKFNLVSFNSRASAWRDRLMDVTERNLQSAWSWIQGLTCQGSTNTYNALQIALSDNQTHAIYLLTDGRPDQPPKSVIAQVQMQNRIPIHTISFNCNDVTANQFLCELASVTRGRFHYFNETGIDMDVPNKYESEDIRMLKEEYSEGLRNLEKVAELRDQCLSLAWKQDANELRKSKNRTVTHQKKPSTISGSEFAHGHSSARPRSAPPRENRISPTPPTESRLSSTPPRESRLSPAPPSRSSSAVGTYEQPSPSQSPRMYSAKFSRRPPTATHTRTSLLRTLSSSGRFTPDAWLLPETKEVLDRQTNRQTRSLDLDAIRKEGSKKRRKRQRKKDNLINDQELTVKQWLGKHGLTAKKLTILDALAPTIIPHKAKYVPILDKHVLAKVFNNILPLAYVSGRNTKQIQLISPTGVNLVAYEEKLEQSISLYKRKLDQLVWDALPDEVKAEFESEEPVSFANNKIKLMKILKELKWPVTPKDITLLEGEIIRGEKFLQQSRDLQRVATEHQEKQSNQKTTTSQGQHDSEDRDEDRKETEKADSDKDVNEQEKDERDMYEEEARVASGLSRELENQSLRDSSERKRSEKSGNATRRKGLAGMSGQKVIARKEADGLYYPGMVIKRDGYRRAVVEFNDMCEETVLLRHIIPISGALPCPILRVGDYVLVRVINTETEDEVYIPGIVQVTPRRIADSAKFYTILTYNNQRVSTMRSYMVKVTKARFELCCRYIRLKITEDSDKGITTADAGTDADPENNAALSPRENIDDLLNRLEDQDNLIQEQERELRDQSDRLARLKKKHEKMARKKSLLEEIIENDKKQKEAAADDVKEDVRNENDEMSQSILAWRRSLPRLTKVGEEVLARWPDDGWYYLGTVVRPEGDYSYVIKDCGGAEETVWREDIITDSDLCKHTAMDKNSGKVLTPHSELKSSSKVVALHPEFSFSYAPATVLETPTDSSVSLQFYDGVQARVDLENVYFLPPEKFTADVDYIKKQEDSRINKVVIFRNDDTGLYEEGKIIERLGDSSQFVIQGSERRVQKTMFIFGDFTKRYRLYVGDRVLALANPRKGIYKPGLIEAVQDGHFTVRFYDNTVSSPVEEENSYWLSETFYDDAVRTIRAKDKES